MNNKARMLALLVLAGWSGSAWSQSPQQSGQVPYAETTAGMVEQAAKDLKAADAELNAVFSQLIAQLDQPGKDRLRVAERKWLAYRDAHADFEASLYEGGSILPLIRTNCLVQMTRNRTKELKEVMESDFGH